VHESDCYFGFDLRVPGWFLKQVVVEAISGIKADVFLEPIVISQGTAFLETSHSPLGE